MTIDISKKISKNLLIEIQIKFYRYFIRNFDYMKTSMLAPHKMQPKRLIHLANVPQ